MINNLPLEKIPHSMLWLGPRHAYLKDIVHKYISMLICQNRNNCGSCRFCHLLTQGNYPDVNYITSESVANIIKIEQIRELQQSIFQTPQIGEKRFIIIEPADAMNTAAANALLKILEEPPAHAVFILI